MKQQVFAAFKGLSGVNTKMRPIVTEYISRKRLSKIGFTSDLSKLPVWKAEAFCFIDAEIDRMQELEYKRKSSKRG